MLTSYSGACVLSQSVTFKAGESSAKVINVDHSIARVAYYRLVGKSTSISMDFTVAMYYKHSAVVDAKGDPMEVFMGMWKCPRSQEKEGVHIGAIDLAPDGLRNPFMGDQLVIYVLPPKGVQVDTDTDIYIAIIKEGDIG